MAQYVFADRSDAGQRLGELLAAQLGVHGATGVVVVGLPRGGVPVARAVADALGAPLDVLVVRKVGVPSHRELAMGAVAEDRTVVVNREVVRATGISPAVFEREAIQQWEEVEARAHRYRAGRPAVSLRGRAVVVVDDGLATGATAEVACRLARARGARRVVLAVPVAPPDTLNRLTATADDVICLEAPRAFFAVGQWYRDFTPTTDDDVVRLLAGHPAPPDDAGY